MIAHALRRFRGVVPEVRLAAQQKPESRFSCSPRFMDEAAFVSFYKRTAPALRSYICLMCGNPTLSDDFLQECFYRFILRDLAELSEPQMKAYLYKTAISLVSDQRRRLRREQFWTEKTVRRSDDSHDLALSQDMRHLFQQLKPKQRTLLWMAYVEGFDHGEIAGVLGMKQKSIRVVLFRARRKLAGILRENGYGPEEGS